MANKYLNDTGLQYFFNKLKTIFLTSVDYDSTNKKITKTLNGTKSDVVTLSTLKTAMELNNVANGAEVNQNAFSNVKVGSTTVAADSKTDTLELAAGTNITLTPDATNDKVTIETSAEVNQNAFSNVKVGSTTIAADTKTDTLTLVAGSNVTITPDATNDKVTIAATDTTYSVVSSSANGLAPKTPTDTAQLSLKYLRADGTWSIPHDTTYSAMTQAEYDTGTEVLGRLISPNLLKTIVGNAIAGVTQISYQVVESLPATGAAGVIYLIAHSHGTGDGYDEYIWLGSSYEKIGNTDVDLSGYMKTTDMVAITTSEIDTLFA